MSVSYQDIVDAAGRLEGIANRTPVQSSRTFNRLFKTDAYFKCENFQRVGAFKFRGGYNALSKLDDTQRKAGVVTWSSGNHAQAIALSGNLLGIPTAIVMPEDAPSVKLTATRSYGAEVILYDKNEINREDLGRETAAEREAVIIPPYDHPDVIAGQGTAAKELIEELGDLDILIACCGGGGLLSGSAIAAKSLCPGVKVIGVEPEAGDDVKRSFETGILQKCHNPDTIADGARTHFAGDHTFPLILEHVDEMLCVSDQDLVDAMYFVWSRMKMIIEPTGALAIAAVMTGQVDVEGKKVGMMISGGNVDLDYALELFKSKTV